MWIVKVFDNFYFYLITSVGLFIIMLTLLFGLEPDSLLVDTSSSHQDFVGPLLYQLYRLGGKPALYSVSFALIGFFAYRAFVCYKRDKNNF